MKNWKRKIISEFVEQIKYIKENWNNIGTNYLNNVIIRWEEKLK